MRLLLAIPKNYVLLLLLALSSPTQIVMGLDGSSEPNTLVVAPGDSSAFQTIQAAIDDACDGDMIFVQPGTYKEILTITNKRLDFFVDSNTQGERVIVDGCFMSSVILNSNDGAPKRVEFCGFEFINGSFGGIELFDADICLVDVIIRGCVSPFGGGGIFQSGGILDCKSCSISNCMSMSDGGATFLANSGIQNFNECNISNNTCNGSAGAIAAVVSSSNSSVNCTACTIDNNTALGGDAGALLSFGTDVNLDDCHLGGNTCTGVGGAAAFANCNSCNINECTIKNNSCNGAGGGLFCQDSNVSILTTICCNNSSLDASGGGIYCIGGNFQCNNLECNGNVAGMNGGGIQLVDLLSGNQRIMNSCFQDNLADLNGGGITAIGPNTLVELIKSKVLKNCAGTNAGGVLIEDAELKCVNTRIMGNKANENGGGCLANANANIKCNGTICDGNSAPVGAGFFVNNSTFECYNSNIVSNSADTLAGGIAAAVSSDITVANSIIFSNGVNNPIFNNNNDSTIGINFSIVEGGFPGTGNQSMEPHFVNELGDDGIPGTGDENFCLGPNSNAIDAGDNASVPEDLHDLDWDGDFNELTPIDFKENNRFVDGSGIGGFNVGGAVVDVGAIEFQTKTSVLLGDVNLDGHVNLLDVQPFVDRLATGAFQAEADINQDGAVNLLDVDPFISILAGQ